jgi:hypothetical protein
MPDTIRFYNLLGLMKLVYGSILIHIFMYYRKKFTVHLKEVTLLTLKRGYRLAWSRIPSIIIGYKPGALAVVGSNPTGPMSILSLY